MKQIYLKRKILKKRGVPLTILKRFIKVKNIKYVNNEEGS